LSKTLNIAHRGFTKECPENTLEAFYAAIRLGIDAVECDVQETADHRFVIHHDDTLNGKNINDLQLRDIRKSVIAEHYQIPSLEETLDLCHNRIRLMLELKQVQSLDLFMETVNAGMKPAELYMTSFSPALVKELADFAPQVHRGIIIDGVVHAPLRVLAAAKARILIPRFGYSDPEMVEELHKHDCGIMVWECNTIQHMRTALDWQADGIITDSSASLALELANRKRLQK
jgi:glycerophosphoryl diester phosphodiesterase